jgi:hypothetical protein
MAQARHFLTIERPVDAVFAFIADGGRCPEWRAGVLDIKKTSGDGVGATCSAGAA